MRKLIALALVLSGALIARPAGAAVTVIATDQASRTTNSYATPVVVTAVGGPLTFLNGDFQPHGLASVQLGPDTQSWCTFFPQHHCPLIWAPVTDAGYRTNAVQGLANTVSGQTYNLYCVIHPNVVGTLLTV
jgi:hypothetical protein